MGLILYFFFPHSKVRVGSWSHLTDVSGTLQYIYSFSYTQVSVCYASYIERILVQSLKKS